MRTCNLNEDLQFKDRECKSLSFIQMSMAVHKEDIMSNRRKMKGYILLGKTILNIFLEKKEIYLG